MSGSLRGWKVPKPTGHPGWCRVVEAHNREECRTAEQLSQEASCASCGDTIYVPGDEDPNDTLCVACAEQEQGQ